MPVASAICLPFGDHASARGCAYAGEIHCTVPRSASTTSTLPSAVTYASRCRAPLAGFQTGATRAAAGSPSMPASPVPSPATTRRTPPVRYAMRVSVRVPPQRGKRIRGRASVQWMRPFGSSAASSFVVAATT